MAATGSMSATGTGGIDMVIWNKAGGVWHITDPFVKVALEMRALENEDVRITEDGDVRLTDGADEWVIPVKAWTYNQGAWRQIFEG